MLRGTQLSAQALGPRIRAQEVISNNLANIANDGFRRDRLAFHAVLAEKTGSAGPAHELVTRPDPTPAAVQATGNALDVALDGPGYFVVQTDDGERYTRSGGFDLGPGGRLQTAAGHAVLGQGGEITLPAGDVQVGIDGSIRVGDQTVDGLRVVTLDSDALVREGENLFSLSPGATPGDTPAETRVLQGHLEHSNVEGVIELVEMIRIFREYETNHKAMGVQGDTLRKLIEQQSR